MSQTNGQPSWAEQVAKIRAGLEDKADSIFANAAPGVDRTQYTEALMQQIGVNKDLAKCSLASLAYTLRDSATLGLVIGSVLGFGYAVARQNSYKVGDQWEKRWEAQFQAGYLGKQKLAYDSPLVAGVTTETVHEKDECRIVNGTDPRIEHEIATLVRGNPIGYYAVVWLASGKALICYRTKQQIDEHVSKYVQGADKAKSAWQTSRDTMSRKTCLGIALKHAPLHAVAREILQREEYAGVETQESFPSGTEAPADDLEAALEAVNQSGEPSDELFPEMHGSELPF